MRTSFENAQASKNEEDEGAHDGGEKLSKRLVEVIEASTYRKADVTDADDLEALLDACETTTRRSTSRSPRP